MFIIQSPAGVVEGQQACCVMLCGGLHPSEGGGESLVQKCPQNPQQVWTRVFLLEGKVLVTVLMLLGHEGSLTPLYKVGHADPAGLTFLYIRWHGLLQRIQNLCPEAWHLYPTETSDIKAKCIIKVWYFFSLAISLLSLFKPVKVMPVDLLAFSKVMTVSWHPGSKSTDRTKSKCVLWKREHSFCFKCCMNRHEEKSYFFIWSAF